MTDAAPRVSDGELNQIASLAENMMFLDGFSEPKVSLGHMLALDLRDARARIKALEAERDEAIEALPDPREDEVIFGKLADHIKNLVGRLCLAERERDEARACLQSARASCTAWQKDWDDMKTRADRAEAALVRAGEVSQSVSDEKLAELMETESAPRFNRESIAELNAWQRHQYTADRYFSSVCHDLFRLRAALAASDKPEAEESEVEG